MSYPLDFKVVAGCVISSSSSDFEVQAVLGSGSFGEVAQCRKVATGETVALKVLKNQDCIEEAKHEVTILTLLRRLHCDKYNIVTWNDSFDFKGRFCLEFEKLDIDLFDYVMKRPSHSLHLVEIRPIVQQLATALEFLASAGIVHADLKPENIMMVDHVRQPLKVKLIDFGMATYKPASCTGQSLQTLWFRSPEVLLGAPINEAIDVWSLGCTAAELLTGRALFPGRNRCDMMRRIISTVGQPPDHLLRAGLYAKKFFSVSHTEDGQSIWRFKMPGQSHSVSLSDLMKIKTFAAPSGQDVRAAECELATFVQLLTGMLKVDAAERMTASQILEHPFICMSSTSSTEDTSTEDTNNASNTSNASNASTTSTEDTSTEDTSTEDTSKTSKTSNASNASNTSTTSNDSKEDASNDGPPRMDNKNTASPASNVSNSRNGSIASNAGSINNASNASNARSAGDNRSASTTSNANNASNTDNATDASNVRSTSNASNAGSINNASNASNARSACDNHSASSTTSNANNASNTDNATNATNASTDSNASNTSNASNASDARKTNNANNASFIWSASNYSNSSKASNSSSEDDSVFEEERPAELTSNLDRPITQTSSGRKRKRSADEDSEGGPPASKRRGVDSNISNTSTTINTRIASHSSSSIPEDNSVFKEEHPAELNSSLDQPITQTSSGRKRKRSAGGDSEGGHRSSDSPPASNRRRIDAERPGTGGRSSSP